VGRLLTRADRRAAGLRPYFFDRLPEAEGAVSDRKLGAHRKPAPLQIEEELPPRLRALALKPGLGFTGGMTGVYLPTPRAA
jgi:hypothetical protein